MDKNILDALIKFGLVTNINVNHEKYKDVDDLINKGIITVPGAKGTINKILAKLNVEEPVETIVEEPVETIVEEPVETIVEEPVETIVEEPVETIVEEPTKAKKGAKKTTK